MCIDSNFDELSPILKTLQKIGQIPFAEIICGRQINLIYPPESILVAEEIATFLRDYQLEVSIDNTSRNYRKENQSRLGLDRVLKK